MQKRAAIYVRVSTDKQTVENQVAALRQIAERRGWEVVEQNGDAGISGSKGRDERPGRDCPALRPAKASVDALPDHAALKLGERTADPAGVVVSIDC
jgi:hypothetical protein